MTVEHGIAAVLVVTYAVLTVAALMWIFKHWGDR